MFVLFFVLASVVTTIFHLPAGVTAPLKELSKFLIIMAMSAIGIAFVSLMMQHILGIW